MIDTSSWQVVEKRVVESAVSSDFPSIDPRETWRPTRHFWQLSISQTGGPGRKFFDRLDHVDLERGEIADTWRAPVGCYLGNDPLFLGAPGDDSRGLVLCKLFDAERRHDVFVLFDAFDVSSGPVAKLHLEEPTPPGFHTSFHPPLLG